ncbi:MAG: DUF2124 domain-containing protein [Candidatus Methanofastidiosa archaeon]|nr:DUF2124 domain-containing protein [Candidatus Methanofastidiosa archaeon]
MEPVISDSRGIKGMLVSFRRIMDQIDRKTSVVFLGQPYTCTPLVDFCMYVIRDIGCTAYYIPLTKVEEAVDIRLGTVSVEYGAKASLQSVDVIVLMGGLAMPNVCTIEEVQDVLNALSHEGTTVVGMCFMNMFDRAGWTPVIPFSYVENCDLTTMVERDDDAPWKEKE